jgi:peroxiredoxin
MVATPSTMLKLGTQAPTFSLPEPKSGTNLTFNHQLTNKGYLIAFICNHCPYVIHLLPKLTELCNGWSEKGIQVYFISSNDVENYPPDSPELMTELANQYGFKFPYLFDEDQSVALSYRAACTPDFFLFDSSFALFYRGQFDDSRPGNDLAVNGSHLVHAIDLLLSDCPPPEIQKPSLGCNLKWKPGNEPEYFVPKHKRQESIN